MGRIAIGGLVGGLVVFVWGFVSHMLLPLGEVGHSVLPDEDRVMEVLADSVPEPGVYILPGLDKGADPTQEDMDAWAAKYEAGPTGFLIYRTDGIAPMSVWQLGIELLADVLAALLAALLLARVSGGYGTRAGFVTLLGAFAWSAILISYWNWYRFPTDFIAAALVDEVVAWLLAGLVMAKIVPVSD